jgi:hypothetical protein
MSHKPKPITIDYSRAGPLPTRRQPALTCSRCRGYYLPDPDGSRAHLIVFGHRPDELIDIPDEDIVVEAELVEETRKDEARGDT